MHPGYRFNWLNEPTCMGTKLKRGSQFNLRKIVPTFNKQVETTISYD